MCGMKKNHRTRYERRELSITDQWKFSCGKSRKGNSKHLMELRRRRCKFMKPTWLHFAFDNWHKSMFEKQETFPECAEPARQETDIFRLSRGFGCYLDSCSRSFSPPSCSCITFFFGREVQKHPQDIWGFWIHLAFCMCTKGREHQWIERRFRRC